MALRGKPGNMWAMKTAVTRALVLALGAFTALCWPLRAGAASLPSDAAQVAQDFLFAFSRNDREKIKGMIPQSAGKLYGPCPFARMPRLSKPRADTRAGAVDFEGPMTDPNLPKRGTMILRQMEEGGKKVWRARQLYWYDELPPEADIPDRSPTAEDRRQEPAVRQAAQDFISAWLAEKWEVMTSLTFQWWEVPRPPPRWVRMTSVKLRSRPTTLDGLRVEFVAKLRVARLLPKQVEGNLWLVKEDGVWRVRPVTFSLAF